MGGSCAVGRADGYFFCREFWVVDILGFTLDGGMLFFFLLCSVSKHASIAAFDFCVIMKSHRV